MGQGTEDKIIVSMVIAEILRRLEAEPNRVITSKLGSGCSARRLPETDSYKVVIPGDTFAQAQIELHYLLFDLGIDVGMSVGELDKVALS